MYWILWDQNKNANTNTKYCVTVIVLYFMSMLQFEIVTVFSFLLYEYNPPYLNISIVMWKNCARIM